MAIEVKENTAIPPAKGHYSPAVRHGDLIYVSGVLPVSFVNGQRTIMGGVAEQTQQALQNLDNILNQNGSCKQQVLKTTVYIPDIANWPVVNELYAEFFEAHKPARTIVPTNTLHFGAMIEIEAIAYIK